MRYTMQNKKTECDGQQLVTGINCQSESVYADFMTTKRLHHKTDGVLFYHMVQSFPKGEAVDPVTAHAAALKLAEYYEGYEVLVCTHTDREHIHSHFLINSVNFDTGKKLHIAKEQLQELRQRNDQVCIEFSLPVFKPKERKQKTKTMTIGEYHTAARGQSKKLQLMNIINDCMRHASNREEFIALMESEGYKVRWEKSRKNITYTTLSGWQCRDRLLFGDKYLKENMEYEFRIREEIIYGRTAGAAPDPDADGRAAESGEASGADERTGWETERKAFFSARHQAAQTATAAPGWSHMGGPADGDGGVASAVVGLGYRLEQSQSAEPVMDSTTMHLHTDKKTLRKKQQKKIAQGHAQGDHEEEQTWQQTM